MSDTMTKTALITGITGQDGSYLAEYLVGKGYEVHGVVRPEVNFADALLNPNLKNISNNLIMHNCNIQNLNDVIDLISKILPDECYHLAASSFDDQKFSYNTSIIETNISATFNILSAIKQRSSKTRFFLAGSALMFGDPKESPQTEKTEVSPTSVYGITKAASYFTVKCFRENYGLYACTGILYNHESVRRGQQFVTRKIARGVAEIHAGLRKTIELGNLNSIRDWGYAPDYTKAMWMMLNNPNGPKDYIISTGITHTVKNILQIAFSAIDCDPKDYISISEENLRKSETMPLIGCNDLISKDLGWSPSKTFEEIITDMVLSELNNVHK